MAGRLAQPWRLVLISVAGLLAIAAIGEIALRIRQGDHLLYHADPEIEYLPQPDQTVMQGGVDMRTNAWGMRSASVDAHKPEGVFRVLVLGDSIVFGHTNIAHDDLATTLLSRKQLDDGRRIEVLNASATSWGPGNMLAWLDRFGTLEADAIILVLSTHDLADDRTFQPLHRDGYPQTKPVSALADWIWRRLTPDPAEEAQADPRSDGDAQTALPLLMRRVAEAPAGGCLIVHPTAGEWKAKTPVPDEQRLEATALASGLAVFYGRTFIDETSDYSDGIHLSPDGQKDLARAFLACPALAGVRD